jgi:CubicO group peptidase (beta-lactamase class C family)
MKNFFVLSAYLLVVYSCSKDTTVNNPASLYFPPVGSATWASVTPASLGWNTNEIPELLNLLETNGTRAFILLKDGKIAMEVYFGQNILETGPFTQSSNWYWASAGKTLTAFLTGIAQEEGYLNIQNKTSDYLGTGWTNLSPAQENAITVWHQLTMTSGLDDGVADNHDFAPESLLYKADPGTRWAYHNAPYTLLDAVIANATGDSFDNYFNQKLRNPIGMDGLWSWINNDHVYFSTARSMARFGLLILNKGKWGENLIMSDKNYFNAMVNTSQDINKSYGYLWWLNGKESFMVPEIQFEFQGSFNPNAPPDMISGIGKNGQYVSIVPSKNIVLVRMGDNPDEALVPFLFLDDIWEKLNLIIQ